MPRIYFTSKQVAVYENGLLLNSFWDKLSKKEQIFFKQLGRGDLSPRENSIEWIKQHHPELDDTAIQKKFNEQTK